VVVAVAVLLDIFFAYTGERGRRKESRAVAATEVVFELVFEVVGDQGSSLSVTTQRGMALKAEVEDKGRQELSSDSHCSSESIATAPAAERIALEVAVVPSAAVIAEGEAEASAEAVEAEVEVAAVFKHFSILTTAAPAAAIAALPCSGDVPVIAAVLC
jgi:hypothetical protein